MSVSQYQERPLTMEDLCFKTLLRTESDRILTFVGRLVFVWCVKLWLRLRQCDVFLVGF